MDSRSTRGCIREPGLRPGRLPLHAAAHVHVLQALAQTITQTEKESAMTTTATVQTLTAEVRVLMVGSRQVTLSVYRQLDYCPPDEIEMFGRVRADKTLPSGCIELVGRTSDGALAASRTFPPSWHEDGTPEFCHWMSHRRHSHAAIGKHHHVFGQRLHWKWWEQRPHEQMSWGCDAPPRRTDLPDDDTGITRPSEIDFENKPRVRLAGCLTDDRTTKEHEGRGTWTYTWLTMYGEPKVWLAVPPEVSLPDSTYARCVIDATAMAGTGGSGYRAVVERLVPPDEDTAQVNKWLQAEHAHLSRIGEFCDMAGLHETWLAAARDENATKQARQDHYDNAAALPLIVLAGLR
jgi:hypothetical protein